MGGEWVSAFVGWEGEAGESGGSLMGRFQLEVVMLADGWGGINGPERLLVNDSECDIRFDGEVGYLDRLYFIRT